MANERKIKPFRVGLTGGIASGKSTVADMFAELGVAVIDTDIIAREVVAPGEPALQEIRAKFGESAIDATGHLDRSAMRKMIFASDEARLDLEAIMHPRIGVETRRQADAAGGVYQLIVVPLLVGSPLVDYVDQILVVDCSEETQIKRLLDRDAETIDQAKRIVAAQASRADRVNLANDIIENDAGIEDIRKRVISLDQKYRRLATRSYLPERSPENS